jgi:hypothetical protein
MKSLFFLFPIENKDNKAKNEIKNARVIGSKSSTITKESRPESALSNII